MPQLHRKIVFTLLGIIFVVDAVAMYPLLATYAPATDAVTMLLPMPIRARVAKHLVPASYALRAKEKTQLERAFRIDPDNPAAWSASCRSSVGKDISERVANCQRAVALQPDGWNYSSLGDVQREGQNYCDAEKSYAIAAQRAANEVQSEFPLRFLAENAAKCGLPDVAAQAMEKVAAIEKRNMETVKE